MYMALLVKKRIMNFRKNKLLNDDQQLLFLQRLHRLLNDGYSLTRALKILEWNQSFIQSTEVITKHLTEGKYIDEAFDQAKFHHTIIAYLYFVRFNHDLITSLNKAIYMFSQRVENRKKFIRIIRYPLVLSFIFIILLLFLKGTILPSFLELFQHSQESSNTIVLAITFIDILVSLILLLIIVILTSFFVWRLYLRKLPIEDQMTYVKKIPIYRSFVRMQTSYYFTTHISMFLKTGMSMQTILKQMTSQRKLPLIAYYASLMEHQLQNGFPLDPLIMNFDFIEPQIAYIFEQQQNNDMLEHDLQAYADYVIQHMEDQMKKTLTLIQPIFFCILASFIIFIYLALMWPMFQIIQTV